MRFVLIISAALVLASCALPTRHMSPALEFPKEGPKETVKPLTLLMREHRELIICCRSFKEFGYEGLRLPEAKNFKIDKDSRASGFNSGRSFFKSFALPEFSTPYTISIKSYLMGENLRDGYIFSPEMIFLNKDHQIVRTVSSDLFEYTGDGPGKPLIAGSALIGKIEITQEMKEYRFIIILTAGKTLAVEHTHSPTKKAPAALTGKKVPLIHAPAGKLRIELYKDTARKIIINK